MKLPPKQLELNLGDHYENKSSDLYTMEKEDLVNHPSHYTKGGIETLDFIKAKLSHKEYVGYLIGNILKYVSRATLKGNLLQDLKKAQFYINDLVKKVEEKHGNQK